MNASPKPIRKPSRVICGDAIATIEGFTREELDMVAFKSQENAARAIDEGRFDKSVIPVLDDDGNVVLDKEEFPKPGTTMEVLAGTARFI